MMMKKTVVITVTTIMLLIASLAQAGVSLVVNGSFENDGQPIDFITEEDAPYRWCDVNLPEYKFGASLWSDWSTHGSYYLTLYSYDWGSFAVNDMATISQQVYLEDVNQIIFDVKLNTTWNDPWNPQIRTAVLLIDDEVVWESNSVGADVRGEYLNQTYDVNDIYKDANSHTLSLGIRANVSGTPWIEYHAQWDFVKFDTHCGSFGYLRGDLDQDCYVDFLDFALLANHWLEQEPAYKYDLFEDGVVDTYDLMFFVDDWLDCSSWEDANCMQVELLLSDIDDSGEVNYGDIFVLAGDWLSEEHCIRADLDGDGIVNFYDFAILVNQWLQKSWLYGLE